MNCIRAKITAAAIRAMKRREKVVALTAYDFPTAQLADQAAVHLILVGDSVGMVMLGYPNTLPVTVREMLHHTKAVVRARSAALVVVDMPNRSYSSVAKALRNADRFVRAAGADGVKLEGGSPEICCRVRALVKAGIPVLGHIGLTPQDIKKLGGYRVQGRTPAEARRLLAEATALERAGAFALVLECIPVALASRISRNIRIPAIGIGAGPACDGQILVSHDLLGFGTGNIPKHAKRYADLASIIRRAFAAYKRDVQTGKFPGPQQSFR